MLKLIKKNLKNEKGLTLIELLVVVVILGIIASIAVVSIGNIIGDTKDKAKVTEAVQIINAAKLKHSTDGNYPTGGWDYTSTNDINGINDYLSNVKDISWTVTWNSTTKKYSIKNHESNLVIKKSASATVTEEVLTAYLNKE
jgi:type IV pilus assembly protein PilA